MEKGDTHGPDQSHMGAIEGQVDTGFTAVDQAQFDSHMQWDVDFLVSDGDAVNSHQCPTNNRVVDSAHNKNYFGTFYEDHSPASGVDSNTSPLEPVTPFGEFVDRAVAEPQSRFSMDNPYGMQNVTVNHYEDNQPDLEVYKPPPVFPSISDLPKEPDPIVDTVTPSATIGYKTLSEPLSEWVANYVWKVCTTGFSLPHAFTVAS
jgi:hypothetical protein